MASCVSKFLAIISPLILLLRALASLVLLFFQGECCKKIKVNPQALLPCSPTMACPRATTASHIWGEDNLVDSSALFSIFTDRTVRLLH